MREVGRAVQRIDIPAEFPVEPLARALFAVDSVIREDLAKTLPNELLRRSIGDGYQIHIALVLRLDPLRVELAEHRPSLTRDAGCAGNPDQFAHCRTTHEAASSAPAPRSARRVRFADNSVMVWIWCL